MGASRRPNHASLPEKVPTFTILVQVQVFLECVGPGPLE